MWFLDGIDVIVYSDIYMTNTSQASPKNKILIYNYKLFFKGENL